MPNRAISFFQPTGAARASPDTGGSGPQDHRATLLFARHLNAGVHETRTALRDLVAALDNTGLAGETIDDCQLIFAEVLNNIAEHAYIGGDGPIALEVALQGDGLLCGIADQGLCLPTGTLPDTGLPKIAPPDHLPEGGFGWHIIRCLACDLAYRRDGAWNRLTFRVPRL